MDKKDSKNLGGMNTPAEQIFGFGYITSIQRPPKEICEEYKNF